MPPKDYLAEFVAEITDDLKTIKEKLFTLHGKPEAVIEAHIDHLADLWVSVYLKIGDFNRLFVGTKERLLISRTQEGKWYFNWLNPLLKELFPERGNTPIPVKVKEALWLWLEEKWINYEASQWHADYLDRCKFHIEVTSPEINSFIHELEEWKKVRHFRSARTKMSEIEEQIALLRAKEVLKKNLDLARRAIELSSHVSDDLKKELEPDGVLYKMLQLIPTIREIVEATESGENGTQPLGLIPSEHSENNRTQLSHHNGERSKSRITS